MPLDTTGMPIGKALKLERVAAGVTSTMVARAVGISIGHLSRIESGQRTATPEMIGRIRTAITEAVSL